MGHRVARRGIVGVIGIAAIACALAVAGAPASAQTGEPIKIGFSMALTGPLAPNGKQALLGAKIWEAEINAKGGLLGRKVQLINYDDQSNPATVPGIYTKLLDVDKVDLIVGPYATNMNAPAMPVVMQRGKTFIGLFALDINSQFHYPKYFSMLPTGPTPKQSFTRRVLPGRGETKSEAADASRSPPRTPNSRATHAKARARTRRNTASRSVYDKTFPPGTTDFSPIIRALQAANADLVIVCSYPLSSVGIVLSANELGLTPKMLGGAMVGLQATVFKDKLKSKLNGIVNYETWVPSPKLMAPAETFFKTYQEQAKTAGVDPLGYYLGGWGYAYFQLLGEAIEGAKSINDDKLADYLRNNEFKTIMGDVRFGNERRMDQVRHDAGAVSRHHRRREPRDLARHELPDGAHAGRPENRRHHLSLREGEAALVLSRYSPAAARSRRTRAP